MTKHNRGNTTPLHDDVQDKLFRILLDMGRKPKKEYKVPSITKNNIVDVADRTDPGHPVFYEVETRGRTKRFKAKEQEFVDRLGRDLVLIDIKELKKAHPKLEFLKVRAWLKERIL